MSHLAESLLTASLQTGQMSSLLSGQSSRWLALTPTDAVAVHVVVVFSAAVSVASGLVGGELRMPFRFFFITDNRSDITRSLTDSRISDPH